MEKDRKFVIISGSKQTIRERLRNELAVLEDMDYSGLEKITIDSLSSEFPIASLDELYGPGTSNKAKKMRKRRNWETPTTANYKQNQTDKWCNKWSKKKR